MTPQFPSRLPSVGTTIFTHMSRLANECGAINLSQGFPDFSPPEDLLARVTHYLHSGANQYAVLPGVLALREAIAEKVARLYEAHYEVESEITVTAGATQALHAAITCCVHPGDEVIVFAPAYDSYVPAIELSGGVVRVATLQAPEFRPDWDEVRALLSPRTRLLIVNTPHNPTGTVWAREDMLALQNILQDTAVLVLSDEVYEHMVFDDASGGGEHVSVARFEGLRERSFVVSSFGKTYHVTGWKIGYCLAPKSMMAEFRKVHQFVVFVANHPIQCALAEFMKMSPGFADDLASFYQAKRDFLRRELAASRFLLAPCAGTYFQLLDYSAISEMPDTDFATWLTREKGVAAIPVSVFYPAGHPAQEARRIRLCFAKNENTLAAAGERLRAI